MIVAKINIKYQITIPRPLREALRLRIGDTLYCTHAEGQVSVNRDKPENGETALPMTIRDRFQITLPIKKLRARNYFEDPAVLIDHNAPGVFCIRSLHPFANGIRFDEHLSPKGDSFDSEIARRYASSSDTSIDPN